MDVDDEAVSDARRPLREERSAVAERSGAEPSVDFDSHYYESEDAFTRHLEKRHRDGAIGWADVDGRRCLLIGGRPLKLFRDAEFRTLPVPGSRYAWYRGHRRDGAPVRNEAVPHEPVRAEYRDPAARFARMDAQGLERVCLYPTTGMLVEHKLRKDPEATHAVLEAFNRWLEETWSFAYRDRIFAAPMLSLAIPERAVAELEWVLARGARLVHLRPAPVPKGATSRSLGAPEHDPFWARVAEARIPVVFHAGDSGYRSYVEPWWDGRDGSAGRRNLFLGECMIAGRAAMDTVLSLIVHGVFERFPGVRVVSVENGAFWVPWLATSMGWIHARNPDALPEPPWETFRRHVWICPLDHEDLTALAADVGVDHILFGSDWPHPEGLAEPLRYRERLDAFTAAEARRIMGENAAELLGLPPLPARRVESAA